MTEMFESGHPSPTRKRGACTSAGTLVASRVSSCPTYLGPFCMLNNASLPIPQVFMLTALLFSVLHFSVASSNQPLVQDPASSNPTPQGDDFIYQCLDTEDQPDSEHQQLQKLQSCIADLTTLSQVPSNAPNYEELLTSEMDKVMQKVIAGHYGSTSECDDEEPILMYADTNVTNSEMTSANETKFWGPHRSLLDVRKKCARFRIRNRAFVCPHNRKPANFHWHPSFDKDGNLVWNKAEAERHVYRREDYCISRRGEGGWVSFKVCISDCTNTTPCVRKCCPPSQVIDANSRSCIEVSPYWRPIFYRSAEEQKKIKEFVAPIASINFGFPDCSKKYRINKSPTNNFKLLLSGKLALINGHQKNYIDENEFCIDGIYYEKTENRGKSEILSYSRSEWDQVVIACKPSTSEIDKWRIPVYAMLNCISALFLLLTDIVYLLLWRQQNIHGWLQFAYVTSLLFTFNCFIVVQRWSEQLQAISGSLCQIMGWLSHLTYLSAFFWLTSMNFDLWWRFSRPLRSIRTRPQDKKRKRFLGFAAFSIGIPLLISGIGIFLDYTKEHPLLNPGFGKEKCYFESKKSQVPYLYFPAGVLLLIDLVFFTSTVFNLRKIHAHTELARTQSTAAMEDKKGLRVIAKLFVVMGVLWLFELASWIAQVLLPDQEIVIWIFMPADMLNSLQGVAIFFIFVCKPNVGNQLLAMFNKDEASNAWNRQIQLPSVATIQQQIKITDITEIK